MKPATPFERFHRLAQTAAFLGMFFTLAGLLGRYVWFFEIFTHFKPQLAVCFLIYAGIELVARRHRHAAVSLAFSALNAVPVLLLLLPSETQATPAAHAPARLRILHANILTRNTNVAALLSLVAQEQPDAIVLLEPNTRWLNDLSPLTNSYPVWAAMPREDNLGAAIYCRTNAHSAEIFRLSDPEAVPSTLARFDAGGRTLTVVGIHALAPYNSYMWRGRNSFSLELAKKLCGFKGPLVVTGDFNNTPWSSHFRQFLEASGLRDSTQGHGLQPTWPVALPPPMRIPLDHCFHSDAVRILSRRPGPDIGSDHLPLIIDVLF
ncbi:MAG: endonuclease/exonuclease/phosphatase family protein [Kiritimatiellae bacterium]|nr:endonuclease/exonuclease/phosphatase family protein [Kiritimatiellia bacterium]